MMEKLKRSVYVAPQDRSMQQTPEELRQRYNLGNDELLDYVDRMAEALNRMEEILAHKGESSEGSWGDKVYPVGSLYMTLEDLDPGDLFGGSWQRFARGTTIIGVDEGDQRYWPGSMGGEDEHVLTVTEMPVHTHAIYTATTSSKGVSSALANTPRANLCYNTGVNVRKLTNTGSGGAHNNLPPYVTCYIWKRVA